MTDLAAQMWDDRASLEDQAGTQDLIAKQIEVEAIAKYVKDGMRVLDAGCGNGLTARELARRYDVDIIAFDSSEKMIEVAVEQWALAAEFEGSAINFMVGNIESLGNLGKFDIIYTERVLINLLDRDVRDRAMANLCKMLRPSGLYVMCENSQEGLDKINRWRAMVDLPKIKPPWHNHYLNADDIDGFEAAVKDIAVHLWADDNDYSSTYYFLSRIVNAAVAAEADEDPDYDSFINRLALKLPPMGDMGQGKIWLWRRQAAKPTVKEIESER